MGEIRAEVAVIGAGVAGLYAALVLARGGTDVVVIERKGRGSSGPWWLNDVPWWMLEEAGLSDLDPAMLGASDCPFLMYAAGQGKPCVRVDKIGLVELDMGRLVMWLVEALERAGGRIAWSSPVVHVACDSAGRVRSVAIQGEETPRTEVYAQLFIDASGVAAVVRKASPWLGRWCSSVGRDEMCTAMQEVRAIDDMDAAQVFLEKCGGKRGEFLSWVGVAGGYSVRRVLVWEDEAKVSILTGAQACHGSSGRAVLSEFLDGDGSWCGDRLQGGGRAIPLRRVYGHLVAPGVALLGDAACQVFAAHGSGIGVGLNAARILAESVLEARSEGHDLGVVRAIWSYPLRFMRTWGATLGYADWMRRWTASMPAQKMQRILESGLMTAGLVEDGLLQTLPNVHPREWLGQLRAALRDPALISYMWPVLSRFPSLGVHSWGYPQSPDLRAVSRYESRLNELARGLG